ncbi:MAG: hypothetical protein GF320_00685 [Armatimonadia bacterium]|nr:hypothetical protein [Armatimonadia bacterium]
MATAMSERQVITESLQAKYAPVVGNLLHHDPNALFNALDRLLSTAGGPATIAFRDELVAGEQARIQEAIDASTAAKAAVDLS